jgi:hypothetical protein
LEHEAAVILQALQKTSINLEELHHGDLELLQ